MYRGIAGLAFLSVLLSVAPRAAAEGWPGEAPRPNGIAADAPGAEFPMRQAFHWAVGGATLSLDAGAGRRDRQDGLAVELRSQTRTSERFAANVTVTWGITDWERGREWIDAGDRAGSWTTGKIEQVGNWVGEAPEDEKGLRFFGALFAVPFLAMTYVAVPACYLGSAGGATSHLQIDLSANYLVVGGPVEVWAEAGAGVVGLPARFLEWDFAVGPLAGLALEAGPVRVGGRALWAPGGLSTSPRAERNLVVAALTVGASF